MSSHQGYDNAILNEVLAPTLNDDNEIADHDDDFVPDSKLTGTIAAPDRRMRVQGRDVPTSKDTWSCGRSCGGRINPPGQETCTDKTCEGKREEGTVVPARASGLPTSKQPVSKPIPKQVPVWRAREPARSGALLRVTARKKWRIAACHGRLLSWQREC